MVGPLAQDLARQGLAHAQPRLVDRDIVQHRIGPGEINVFEYARRQLLRLRADMAVQVAVEGDEHGLARADIPFQLEADRVECRALGGQGVFDSALGLAAAEHHRPDPVRIAEADNAVAADQRDGGECAPAPLVHAVDRLENMLGREPRGVLLLQLVCEDVQQRLGIGAGTVQKSD